MSRKESGLSWRKWSLVWVLFLLLLFFAAVLSGRFSPVGFIRGLKYLVASSSSHPVTKAPDTTEVASSLPKDKGQLILRAIAKQRRELAEKQAELDRFAARLEQEKREIIQARKSLEAMGRKNTMFPMGWFYRYLPFIVMATILLWAVLFIYLLFQRSRKGKEERSISSDTTESRDEGLSGDLESLKSSLETMISEVEETAYRVPAELKEGSLALQELIREADRRVGQLQALLDQASKAYTSPARQEGSEPKSEEVKLPRQVDKNQLVYQLADEGLAEDEIARRLNLGIGEVQLILNLRTPGEESL